MRCQSYAAGDQCVLERGHKELHDFLDVELALRLLTVELDRMGTTIERCRIYRFDDLGCGYQPVLYADCGAMTTDTSRPWLRMLYSNGKWRASSGRIKT